MPNTSAIIDGSRAAPAMPWRPRATIKSSGLGARLASSDAAANAAPPSSMIRRRPMRSPSAPNAISAPAIRNP